MITSRLQNRTPDDIQVNALSSREWRICDSRIADDNALSLIGFIDEHHGIYEVMEFIGPVEHSHFSSLEAAISHFVTAKPSLSEERRLEAVTQDSDMTENHP